MKKLLRLLALINALLDAYMTLLSKLYSRLAPGLPMGRLLRNRRGFQGVIIAVVSTLILLFCAILVMVTFINNVSPDTTWSLVANTTWTNVQSYAWTAVGLVAIGIIILGAVAILSIVSRMGQPQGGQGL